MGKWVDQVGDTWEFKADGKLSAVASGKAYDTTWTRVDDKTIKIDFGPILSMVGDPKAVLTIPYKISGDSLTLTVGGNDVPLTKSK
jgi:hypothetical protein